MNSSDLYKLSKDELIHLVSTIQHDLAAELKQSERNTKIILDTVREKFDWIYIEKCSFKGCHRFSFFQEQNNEQNCIDYFNDGRITFCTCSSCDKTCDLKADKGIGWWCREHVPSDYVIDESPPLFTITCGKCVANCADN